MPGKLPSLNAIRVFEAAARHENFSRAAAELSVTQSAVSRQVQVLEGQLGRRLFERRGPKLVLTDTGRHYHAVVEEGLSLIRRGTERLLRTRPGPFLTLSVLPSFAAKWLAPRLREFESRHPGIALRLALSYSVTDFNAAADVDVAVRYGRGRWSGVYAEPILKDQIFPVCSPAVAARLRNPEDLRGEQLLLDNPVFDEWGLWAEAVGLELGATKTRALTDDFNIQLQVATEGQGVALARGLLVADDLRAGRLVAPFQRTVTGNVQYHFVCPEERLDEPAIATLKSWMVQSALATVRGLDAYIGSH